MPYKQKISISDLKFRPDKFVKFIDGLNREITPGPYTPGGATAHFFRSTDLMTTDFYISGIVTAHFTFPLHPNDSNYANWYRFDNFHLYSDIREGYPDSKFFNGTGDILFIQDGPIGMAVVGTQFYGKSSIDNAYPPNVDSAYVPHRYHIQVGDTLELYSGQILYFNKFEINDEYMRGSASAPRVYESDFSKTYLSLVRSMVSYTVIPNESYISTQKISKQNKIINDVYNGKIDIKKNIVTPRRISIPLVDRLTEGSLVTIKNVRFSKKIKRNLKSDTLHFLPGRLYTVEDDSGNEIDFRICHGTEMAKFFTKTSFSRPFNLTGIVVGTDAYGRYEIWPRTMYDLGKPQPKEIVSEYSGGLLNEI